jgi:hypothetical protein
LLLTSSSRARSLMRTLLIQSFCGPGDPDPGCSPARLAGHSSLNRSRSWFKVIIP